MRITIDSKVYRCNSTKYDSWFVYTRAVQKVLSFTKILDLLYTSYLFLVLTATEIRTEIWISLPSFIRIVSVFPQQKCSAMVLLSEWSLELFEWHTLWIYIYIYIYMCVCVCVCVCGAFNKFPDLFVQAFKIVVDSWKFTMLLLDILWDDWHIFRISGSIEQLQQQLEYTLLKHDCHSWWISKIMQSGREDTLEERYAIKFCFKLGKNATETYGILQTAFGLSCINRASIFQWHKRFKEGRESVRNDERCGRNKEVNTLELIDQRVRVRVSMLRF